MAKRRELLGAVAAMGAGAGLMGWTGDALAQRRAAPHAAAKKPAAPPPPSDPASTPLGPVDTQARQAILIDVNTGAVLLEKNADERMTPSSMTKLVTMYIVFDMIRQGRLRMD